MRSLLPLPLPLHPFRLPLAGCLFAFLALVHPAMAAVVVSNLSTTATNNLGLASGQYYGFAFTTGASSFGYNLNNVTLTEQVNSLGAAQISVAIYSNSGSQPDWNAPVALQQTSITTGYNVPVTYSPTGSLVLAPGTTYWIVLTGSSGGNSFLATNNSSYTSADSWVLPNKIAYSSSGGIWQIYSNIAGRFSVDAVSVVPEPSAAALGAIGFAALIRRRRMAC